MALFEMFSIFFHEMKCVSVVLVFDILVQLSIS